MSTTQDIETPPRPDLGGDPDGEQGPGIYDRVLGPSRGWISIDWRELYHSRELFDTLVLRDVKVRYKQTVLGVAWAVIQPLMSTFVFTLLFGNFAGVKPVGVPYELFVLAGLVPWTFFTNAVSGAGLSLITQQQLLTKVYFPRLFVPAASVGAQLVDLTIGLSLFAIAMPLYRYAPGWGLVALPVIVLMTFVAAFGLGLIFAAMTILYRDLRFIIPFVMQILMFASTVFYPPSQIPDSFRYLASLNPMIGLIAAYRWSILGIPADPAILAISAASAVGMLVFGLFFFRRTERYFADLA